MAENARECQKRRYSVFTSTLNSKAFIFSLFSIKHCSVVSITSSKFSAQDYIKYAHTAFSEHSQKPFVSPELGGILYLNTNQTHGSHTRQWVEDFSRTHLITAYLFHVVEEYRDESQHFQVVVCNELIMNV